MNQKIKKIRQLLWGVLIATSVIWISSCEKYSFTLTKIDPEDPVHFQTEIQPIFTEKCISCHGAAIHPDLRDGNAFQSLTDGGFVELPAETSKLYLKMTSSGHFAKSSDADKQKVLIWITQGAMNN